MNREPQLPREPGLGPDLDETQAALERYGRDTADYPSRELAERVMRAVEAEPAPRRGLLAALFPSRPGGASTPMRLALVVATVMAAAVLALAAGGISQLLQRNVGSSASPAVTESIAPSGSEEPSLTPSPSQTPTATPAPSSVSPSSSPGSVAPSQSGEASPSASDDHESDTPEPSATPRASDTPRPSETPHSDG